MPKTLLDTNEENAIGIGCSGCDAGTTCSGKRPVRVIRGFQQHSAGKTASPGTNPESGAASSPPGEAAIIPTKRKHEVMRKGSCTCEVSSIVGGTTHAN